MRVALLRAAHAVAGARTARAHRARARHQRAGHHHVAELVIRARAGRPVAAADTPQHRSPHCRPSVARQPADVELDFVTHSSATRLLSWTFHAFRQLFCYRGLARLR